MNGGLIGSLLLLGYAVYSGYDAKSQGLDWTPLLNAKVWGGGLAGLGSLFYNVKGPFMDYWKSLPGLTGIDNQTKVNTPTVVDNGTKVSEEVAPEVEELNLNNLERNDSYCLTYLMKRVKRAKSEEGLKLLKALHDEFYNIHSGEVKGVE